MKNISFLSENFQFLEVKFSIFLNRRVFIMVFIGQGGQKMCFRICFYLLQFSILLAHISILLQFY